MLKLQIKGKLLIQAQQLQVYLRNVDDAMMWIGEHENTVLSHEMGSDLERNEVLQKKFDIFLKVREGCIVSYFRFAQLLLLCKDFIAVFITACR